MKALFGGTFDPPHIGHLAAARAALAQLPVDEVVFVVAGEPWHKGTDPTPAPLRLAMTLALVGVEFSVSSIEIDRGGPSYTVDTLDEVGEPVWLVVGGDAALAMEGWKYFSRLKKLAKIAAVSRGEDFEAPEYVDQVVVMSPVDVSSSGLRKLVRLGGDWRSQTTPAVAEIIESEGLYK